MYCSTTAQDITTYFKPEIKSGQRATAELFMQYIKSKQVDSALTLVGPRIKKRRLIVLTRVVRATSDTTNYKILIDLKGDHPAYICRYNKFERLFAVIELHFYEPVADAKIAKIEHKNVKQVKREWKKRMKDLEKIKPIE